MIVRNKVQASIIVTYRCNAKCRMCNTWKFPTDPSEEISPSHYEKLPDGLRVNITGGEPMIREDIDDIFRIMHPKASLLELSTNGFFTDRIVRVAERYPDILIRVSCEGLPSRNDTLRGTKDGFDHALRTILALKRTKCRNIGFSIVISDRNAEDLLNLYDLCAYLGVELGNSVMHNSWYFHKDDNKVEDVAKAVRYQNEFIRALLSSKRRGIRNKLKDYGRAWFNRSIVKRMEGQPRGYRPPCGAGSDFFFVDPWGNVSPCNGSEEEWIIGNIKDESFDHIMNSDAARAVMERIEACTKECCFIVTDRHDMLRRPWRPIAWALSNKLRILLNLPIRV